MLYVFQRLVFIGILSLFNSAIICHVLELELIGLRLGSDKDFPGWLKLCLCLGTWPLTFISFINICEDCKTTNEDGGCKRRNRENK